ncbi:MAG TPA: hypothetical protein VM536_09490 [Chloroflexia bacterium]|nr:hypothetical protein [Chloroflexia bacterium]
MIARLAGLDPIDRLALVDTLERYWLTADDALSYPPVAAFLVDDSCLEA